MDHVNVILLLLIKLAMVVFLIVKMATYTIMPYKDASYVNYLSQNV